MVRTTPSTTVEASSRRMLRLTISATLLPAWVHRKVHGAGEAPHDRLDVVPTDEGDSYIDGPDRKRGQHHGIADPVSHRDPQEVIHALISRFHTLLPLITRFASWLHQRGLCRCEYLQVPESVDTDG